MNRGLLEQLPEISRARGYRLYCNNGKRIIDFYQDSGKAVLGHRVSGTSLSMKQAVDKGVFFSCRTRYDIRLKNAVKAFAGDSVFFSVFTDYRTLFAGLGREEPCFFPVPENPSADTVFWHPFSGYSISDLLEKYRYVIPVIPMSGSFSPALVLSRKQLPKFPSGDSVSPVLLAPFINVIYKLIESLKSNLYEIWDAEAEEIKKLWERKGAYLIPCYDEKNHEKVFKAFLERGYLLSPVYSVPSVLPGEISRGEMENFMITVNKISGEIK